MNAGPTPPKRQLGRGLSALLGDEAPPPEAPATAGPVRGAVTAPVEYLRPSRVQPRREFVAAEIESLAESIRERGILQPILVRPDADHPGRYEIVAGERRWRASQLAQLHEVPIVVRELSDEGALEVALIENVQRADLNPIEEGLGYKRLIDDFRHTQESIARIIGKSRVHIANTLRLLGLPDSVRNMVSAGELTPGHARALLNESDAEVLARWIVKRWLNVRQTERLIAKRERDRPTTSGGPAPAARLGATLGEHAVGYIKDADTLALEDALTTMLGLKVTIDFDPRTGAGRIVVDYQTLEQLDEVIRRLRRSGAMPGTAAE